MNVPPETYSIATLQRGITMKRLIALLWAVAVLAFEALSLCCLNSMARLGELYLAAAKKGVRRKATLRYAGDQLFFTGLVFLFYLLRGVTMRLLTS